MIGRFRVSGFFVKRLNCMSAVRYVRVCKVGGFRA